VNTQITLEPLCQHSPFTRLGQHTTFAPQLPFRSAIPTHINATAKHSAIFICDTFKHLIYFTSFYRSFCTLQIKVTYVRRDQLKCDGTRAETIFRLSAKRTSPFKSAGTSVQSTTGSRGVRIGGRNARYTMFRGSAKGTGYPTPFASFPFTSPPVRRRVPSHFNWTPLYSHVIYCSADHIIRIIALLRP